MLIWDYGRMINLCRYGFDCGYLTEEETVDAARKI